MGFQIQERSIGQNIWTVPDRQYWVDGPVRSASVDDLRATIHAAADKRTLSFAQHLRIVTDDGAPVERWKVRPGRAKRLRRRY